MAAASIYTLDGTRGGVPVFSRAVYELLERAGHQPTLVYRATDDVPRGSRVRTLAHCLTTPPVRRIVRDGMTSTAITAYPVPPRFQYHQLQLARRPLRAPIAAVVSGSSHAGLALAVARRPYVLWTSTLYGDEIRARVEAGDAWARNLLNGSDWPVLEQQERLVYERASIVLVNSPRTLDRVGERWPHLADKLQLLFTPIDTRTFSPAEAPEQSSTILMTSRFRDPRKNAGMLIRAVARVRAEHPGVRLVLAGDDPDPDMLALVRDLGMSSTVTFPGYVDARQLPALYGRAAIFALSSRQEGLGISVQEAMAAGLPVISTRCGGPEGLVEHGVSGLLVPNDNEQAMASAIVELLRSADRRRALGAAARDRAVRTFSREQIEPRLRRAFEQTFGALFIRAGG